MILRSAIVQCAGSRLMNKDGFWPGVIFGFIVGSIFMMVIANTEMVFYNKAQCEAELPRNQTCKIVIKAEIE